MTTRMALPPLSESIATCAARRPGCSPASPKINSYDFDCLSRRFGLSYTSIRGRRGFNGIADTKIMIQICPNCQCLTDPDGVCRHCGATNPAESSSASGHMSVIPRPGQSVGRSQLAGLLLAQGLFFSLQHIGSGLILT